MVRLAALALLLLTGCQASTDSTQVGVRVNKLGLFGSRGVEKAIYAPGGSYFFFRPLYDWYVFDINVQNLAMTGTPDAKDPQGARGDALRFKTIDGNDVWVDVTISWSIDAEQAPYILEFGAQSTPDVEAKIVRPVARSVVRDVLNQLTSEEYYQADYRAKTSDEAKDRLNDVLQGEGIHVDQVQFGEHHFNPTYEELIRDKKVAEQEAERLNSETEASVEEKRRDAETLKGQIEQNIALAEGESAKKKRDADAIRYEKEQEAAAIRIEAQAKAEGMRARAAALVGPGGVNMVKLKIAAALKGKKILFLPAGSGMDVRTTDINALLQTYGISAIADAPPAAPKK